MSKIDPELFRAEAHALARSHGPCPQCGAELVLRHGKHGPFLGCSAYPQCDYVRARNGQGGSVEKILEGTQCPECGDVLVIRKGRYGLFIACRQFPDCRHVEQDGEPAPAAESISCPACGKGQLVARQSRQGKLFYACDAYPKCKFVVNDPPVAQPCPQCGSAILVRRQGASGAYLCCPQKNCTYRSDSL